MTEGVICLFCWASLSKLDFFEEKRDGTLSISSVGLLQCMKRMPKFLLCCDTPKQQRFDELLQGQVPQLHHQPWTSPSAGTNTSQITFNGGFYSCKRYNPMLFKDRYFRL